jgi:hypothetical protein
MTPKKSTDLRIGHYKKLTDAIEVELKGCRDPSATAQQKAQRLRSE